ncbi:hypothetical protein [Actinosynnema sp. NPDC020468]|uniref:hypothetical protein n=1 Tax=Actinosynnema sp. NPDC020468 TaxID=3154488 RepID=UPI0033C03A74
MWCPILDVIATVASWPWLDPLTTVLRAVNAVVGFAVATYQVIRLRRDHHRGVTGDRYRDGRRRRRT